MNRWSGVTLPARIDAGGGLTFVPLTPQLLDEDYAAVMRDIQMLRDWSGQNWPTADFTRSANLRDLQRHDREQRDGEALTYSVLIDHVVSGCIYVQPMAKACAARGIEVGAVGADAFDDTVVRGWLHDRPATQLIDATMAWLTAAGLVHGRLWWQTNSRCPDQLAACDAAGLSDVIELGGRDRVWVLRSDPR